MVKDECHVLQNSDSCVASSCVLLTEGCYLGGRVGPKGVAGLESDEGERLAKGVRDEFLVVSRVGEQVEETVAKGKHRVVWLSSTDRVEVVLELAIESLRGDEALLCGPALGQKLI